MAIERNLSREKTEIRAPLPTSYAKISDVEIRLAGREQVWIHVLTFADADARKDPEALSVNKETFRTTLLDFVAAGEPAGWSETEIKAAAYRWLKKKSEFSSGADV